MHPPYTITPQIINLVSQVSRLLGQYEGLTIPKPEPKLRRTNRIKSIQGSLAIEGNSLNLEQVTALFNNQRVIGPKKEILEVKNAIHLYDQVGKFSANSIKDFLKAHQCLMKGLIVDAGQWRKKAVGILQGSRVVHIAPPANRIPHLMDQLFKYLQTARKENGFIVSSVLHYEIEFIHPFSDGNGRMGRFWQFLFLVRLHPLFQYLPVESIIHHHQEDYYQALNESDKKGEAGPFVEFCLRAIQMGLLDFLHEMKPVTLTSESRLEMVQEKYDQKSFSRRDYLKLFKTLSTATASRDLQKGVKLGRLKRTGDKALAQYRFVK